MKVIFQGKHERKGDYLKINKNLFSLLFLDNLKNHALEDLLEEYL